jgi:hypothetical protein
MSLLRTTQKLLERAVADDTSLRQLAEASEGSVEYEWLVKFAQGSVKDPGVNRVQALHDFLLTFTKRKAA